MRLVTFQDQYVIDKIKFEEEEGRVPVYINNHFYFTKKEEPLILKFKDKMKDAIKIKKLATPIFCWVIKKDQELTDEFIDELYVRYIPKCRNIVVIELDVPDEGVFVSNYDVWSKIIFNLQINKTMSDEEFNLLFKRQKGATLQACIPFIHKRFIKSYKIIDNVFDRDYSDTESEVQRMIENREIELDDDGNIESLSDE